MNVQSSNGEMKYAPINIGSIEHRKLFCEVQKRIEIPRFENIGCWPSLTPAEHMRLILFTRWSDPLTTARQSTRILQKTAQCEADAILRHAFLQLRDNGIRHTDLLSRVSCYYGLHSMPSPAGPLSSSPYCDYLYMGHELSADYFLIFGLFSLARKYHLLPLPLLYELELPLQAKADEIIFFVNWVAYRRAHLPWTHRPLFDMQRLCAMVFSIIRAIKITRRMYVNGTLLTNNLIGSKLAILRTLWISCIGENDRRFQQHDARLLRPWLLSYMARMALICLRKSTI